MYWKWRNCFLINPKKRAELFVRNSCVFFWHLKHLGIFPVDDLEELRLTIEALTIGSIEIGYTSPDNLPIQAYVMKCAIEEHRLKLPDEDNRPRFRGFDGTVSLMADLIRTNDFKGQYYERHYGWDREIERYWAEVSRNGGADTYHLFELYELNKVWDSLVDGIGIGVGSEFANLDLQKWSTPEEKFDSDDQLKLKYIATDADSVIEAMKMKGWMPGISLNVIPDQSIYRRNQSSKADNVGENRFCTKCGAERDKGAQFCGKCGSKF